MCLTVSVEVISSTGYRRNGSSRKTTLTGSPKVTLDIPRERAGKRTYILRYRVVGGLTTPQRTYTIGQHGSPWTVDQAWKRALDLLAQVRAAVDPAEMRDAIRKGAQFAAEVCSDRMFASLADRWFRQHVVAGGLRSEEDIRSVLDRDLKPALLEVSVEITKEVVAEVMDRIGDRSRDAANKAFKRLGRC